MHASGSLFLDQVLPLIAAREHHWCSGNMNAFQAFASGSIPGWCILFAWRSSGRTESYRIVTFVRYQIPFVVILSNQKWTNWIVSGGKVIPVQGLEPWYPAWKASMLTTYIIPEKRRTLRSLPLSTKLCYIKACRMLSFASIPLHKRKGMDEKILEQKDNFL